tara:strand:+ start:907 stop:1188 length:282 start_codon:yes stop_codon:yes gene_type:complete
MTTPEQRINIASLEERISKEKFDNMYVAFGLMAKEIDLSHQDAFYCILKIAAHTCMEALGPIEAERTLRNMLSKTLDDAKEQIQSEADENRLN